MARTLFTFLGRGAATPDGGYRETRYDLPAAVETTTYFALALVADRLKRGPAFDRIVVLGTSGSMWDDLAVKFAGLPATHSVVLDLRKAARDAAIGEIHLSTLSRAIADEASFTVDCVLIPDCRRPEEIASVVSCIADRIVAGDIVEFDVTHGYRHLPLLALSALNLVSATRNVTIAAVHYGAYEMRDQADVAPVLDLKAYLDLMDWSRALAAFDASGDPTGLGRLIEAETGAEVADEIADAAHRERMLDIDAVRGPWRKARLALARTSGIGALFTKALDTRFAWTGEPSLARRQRALARQALDKGDALRATLLLFEAAITMTQERDGAEQRALLDREAREVVRRRLYRFAPFRELNKLRNLLAHSGARDDASARECITTPVEMLASLGRIDEALFATDRTHRR